MNVKKAKRVMAKLQAICDEGEALVEEVSALNAAGKIGLDDPRYLRMNELAALMDKLTATAEKINNAREWN